MTEQLETIFLSTGAPDMLARFFTGLIVALVIWLAALLVTRRASRWAQARAITAEQAARDEAVRSGVPFNGSAGRAWNTAAQLLPLVVWSAAIFLIASILPIDLSFLTGALAGGAVGFALALQNVLSGIAAKQIIVGEDLLRVGDAIQFDGRVLTVQSIGFYATKFVDHAADAIRPIPNAMLISGTWLNYDGVLAAKFVLTLPCDDSRMNGGDGTAEDHISVLESAVTKAIRAWSVGNSRASCELANVAPDAYEFRLVGFTESPVTHPQATVDCYHAAVDAAHAAGYSIGRTNNNTHSLNKDLTDFLAEAA